MSPIGTVVVHCRSVFVSFSLGCTDDQEQGSTIGMKTSHLARSLLSQTASEIRDDSFLAMHPSDHNTVLADQMGRKYREVYDDHDNDGSKHGLAFLVPVPLMDGYDYPLGMPLQRDEEYGSVSHYSLPNFFPNRRNLGLV